MPLQSFLLPPEQAGCSFAAFCAASDVCVPFFRSLVASLQASGIDSYRLKILPCDKSFEVCVSSGKVDKAGPREFNSCLSCEPQRSTIAENNYVGGEAARGPPGGLPERLRLLTAADCEWQPLDLCRGSAKSFDSSLVRVWADAQGRPLMIVTPRRHYHGLHDMTDAELGALWFAVSCVLQHAAGPEDGPGFEQCVLHVGRYRNLEHCHVKLWHEAADFVSRISRWPADKQALQRDLRELRRLMKLPDAAALREELGAGEVELLVRGSFAGADDEAALRTAFGVHGAVVGVNLGDARFEGSAVVTMADADAAVAAMTALNLTCIGSRNVGGCKVKLVASLLKNAAHACG